MDGNEALSTLVGGHLDTVSFVMDCVEFRINHNVLRAVADPYVELHDGTTARFPDPGSRDALCRLIDTEVVSAAEGQDGRRIEVRTNRGDLLVTDNPYPELAHLVPANDRGELEASEMYVWRSATASAWRQEQRPPASCASTRRRKP